MRWDELLVGGRNIPHRPPRPGIPCAQAVALKALAILQTYMVLLFFLFVLLIAYSKTETPFLFCCTQLHPLNTPDKSISAAPFTPGAGLWRALFKRHFKMRLMVARYGSCSKIRICSCLLPAPSTLSHQGWLTPPPAALR